MGQLWAGFDPITDEQWRAAIVKELKGADYDTTLRWLSPEGIIAEPFYTAQTAGPGLPIFSSQQPWQIAEYIRVTDPVAANRQALDALAGGAEHILYDLDHRTFTVADLSRLLEDILLDVAPVYFLRTADAGMAERVLSEKKATGSMALVEAVSLPGSHTGCLVNMQLLHYSGDNMVEELANGLSQAHEHLLALADKGISAQDASEKIFFLVSCGQRYLFEIAKLRAMQWLWVSLCRQYGAEVSRVNIIAESSVKSFSAVEADTHMIRNTAQVMAAALGGARLVYAHPHADDALHPGFGERMARNIQHLLREESYLHEAQHPVDGAWFFESVTRQLAEKAWDRFRGEG